MSASRAGRRVTRNGTGAIGPARWSAQSGAVVAIDVQEPKPRRLEPVDHHLRETRHQVVAETRGPSRTSRAGRRRRSSSRGREKARARRSASGTAGRATTSRRPRQARASRSSTAPRGRRRTSPARRCRGAGGRTCRLVAVAEEHLARPRKRTFDAAAGDQLSSSALRPWKTRTSLRQSLQSSPSSPPLGRADRRQLLGHVDPDRAPGDAAAAADAARAVELVVPGAELVGQPLAVARRGRTAGSLPPWMWE